MCYDISFTAKLKNLSNYFSYLVASPQRDLDFESNSIIAHRYPEYPIVRRNHEGGVIIAAYGMGVIPFYVKDANKFIRQRHRRPLFLPLELSKNGLNRTYPNRNTAIHWVT
jgi:hypothetical protein